MGDTIFEKWWFCNVHIFLWLISGFIYLFVFLLTKHQKAKHKVHSHKIGIHEVNMNRFLWLISGFMYLFVVHSLCVWWAQILILVLLKKSEHKFIWIWDILINNPWSRDKKTWSQDLKYILLHFWAKFLHCYDKINNSMKSVWSQCLNSWTLNRNSEPKFIF